MGSSHWPLSHPERGKARPDALRRPAITPNPSSQQPRHPRVVPRARVAPMDRIIHVAPAYWIEMGVIQLLPHHVSVLNLLRMTPLLPQLMLAIGLKKGFVMCQLLQDESFAAALECIDNSPCRERLEVADLFAEIC